jgi:hypothetical protein
MKKTCRVDTAEGLNPAESKLAADGPERLALREVRADGRTGLLKGAVYSPSPGAVAGSSL